MSKGKEEATVQTDPSDDEEAIGEEEDTGNEGSTVGKAQISQTRKMRRNERKLDEDPKGDSENDNEDDFEEGASKDTTSKESKSTKSGRQTKKSKATKRKQKEVEKSDSDDETDRKPQPRKKKSAKIEVWTYKRNIIVLCKR